MRSAIAVDPTRSIISTDTVSVAVGLIGASSALQGTTASCRLMCGLDKRAVPTLDQRPQAVLLTVTNANQRRALGMAGVSLDFGLLVLWNDATASVA
jgi:hypothetical protein